MLKQVWKRADNGEIITDYVPVTYPRNPQPAKRRECTTRYATQQERAEWEAQDLAHFAKRDANPYSPCANGGCLTCKRVAEAHSLAYDFDNDAPAIRRARAEADRIVKQARAEARAEREREARTAKRNAKRDKVSA